MRAMRLAALSGLFVLASVLAVSTVWVAAVGAGGVRPAASAPTSAPTDPSLPGETIASAPTGQSQPDDLAYLPAGGLDHGHSLLWTEFQNHINPNGTPSSQFGATESLLAGFDPVSGQLVRAIPLWGHVDGVTADPAHGVILATTDEDANSELFVINPGTGAVTTYQYAPSPTYLGNGGTDSIAILGGNIYLSHSNPEDSTQATVYLAALSTATLTVTLTPVFYDNSQAKDATTGQTITMALTDPDTNYAMPVQSPKYGGDLMTISQGDGRLIFASHLPDDPVLSQLNLTDNVSGNVPPLDGFAVATSSEGTLYVTDALSGTITALSTAGWPSGTVFVTEPNDNGNPLLGTLNLTTGVITPLGNHFADPKGLLFEPGDQGGSKA